MIKLKNILSEAYVWDRKFGEPLPTLTSIIEKSKDCDCGGTCCGVKEAVVTEGPDDVRKSKKELQRIMKAEAKLRERMMKLEQIFLDDPRPENQKLAKEIKESYKKHVTTFMKDVIKLTKKVK
tara:strand:+ start:471 stop:839 length:369 start_codon:yes stop_codon:yes gene_type:complete